MKPQSSDCIANGEQREAESLCQIRAVMAEFDEDNIGYLWLGLPGCRFHGVGNVYAVAFYPYRNGPLSWFPWNESG